MHYYNEFDSGAAAWIRQLIACGAIPEGDVDERSIEDVRPSDLAGYTQCHFFAGIAGWAAALAIAGVPASTPLWTASCPCQPFSTAGEGAGFDDERHLWPALHWLIEQCEPPVIFGEQVASKAAGAWVDLVHADVEALGYAFGCVPFPAASVGAPHIRDRNYWMAYASGARLEGWRSAQRGVIGTQRQTQPLLLPPLPRLPDADCERRSGSGRLVRPGDPAEGIHRQVGGVVHAGGSYWSRAQFVPCADGYQRLLEPGIEPLAYGIPARVGRLRGYGNAIVPPQAAEFVSSGIEVILEQQK